MENEKPRKIEGEEAEKLTESLTGYHNELRKRIDKFLEDSEIDLEIKGWDGRQTPIPNIGSIPYDKENYDIDTDLTKILNEVNLKYFPHGDRE